MCRRAQRLKTVCINQLPASSPRKHLALGSVSLCSQSVVPLRAGSVACETPDLLLSQGNHFFYCSSLALNLFYNSFTDACCQNARWAFFMKTLSPFFLVGRRVRRRWPAAARRTIPPVLRPRWDVGTSSRRRPRRFRLRAKSWPRPFGRQWPTGPSGHQKNVCLRHTPATSFHLLRALRTRAAASFHRLPCFPDTASAHKIFGRAIPNDLFQLPKIRLLRFPIPARPKFYGVR